MVHPLGKVYITRAAVLTPNVQERGFAAASKLAAEEVTHDVGDVGTSACSFGQVSSPVQLVEAKVPARNARRGDSVAKQKRREPPPLWTSQVSAEKIFTQCRRPS